MIGVIHVHSRYSHDGRDSIADLRAFAIARDLSFVALSDHAEDLDEASFRQLRAECEAETRDGLRMIAGLEFRFAGFKGMHLLALGLTRWIEPQTPADFTEMTRGVTGLTVAAHPLLPAYILPEVVRSGIDAIEVWNASYNTRFLPDPRAMRLLRQLRAQRPEVVAVAGLDQHDARNDRQTRIVLDAEGDPLAMIRAGQFRNRGLTMSFGPRAELGRTASGTLWLARTVFDRIERMQDRAVRRMRQARRPRP